MSHRCLFNEQASSFDDDINEASMLSMCSRLGSGNPPRRYFRKVLLFFVAKTERFFEVSDKRLKLNSTERYLKETIGVIWRANLKNFHRNDKVWRAFLLTQNGTNTQFFNSAA